MRGIVVEIWALPPLSMPLHARQSEAHVRKPGQGEAENAHRDHTSSVHLVRGAALGAVECLAIQRPTKTTHHFRLAKTIRAIFTSLT
jgi:hypothetical protein